MVFLLTGAPDPQNHWSHKRGGLTTTLYLIIPTSTARVLLTWITHHRFYAVARVPVILVLVEWGEVGFI